MISKLKSLRSSIARFFLFFPVLLLISVFTNPVLSQSVTAPSFTYRVADTTIYNLISLSGTTITVSGLDPVKVIVSATSGTLKITTTAGLTAPTGYTSGQWTGTNDIGFEGTLINVNNALATLEYLGSGTITVSPTSSSVLYYPGTGNYYEFINTNSSWTAAQINANSRTLGSSSGYLATVTSAAEFTYIKSKAGLGSEIWIGGSDNLVEGEWRWKGGPETGQQFWQGKGTGATPPGAAVGGMYTSWNGTGEPNDSSSNEDCLAILTSGLWNDYPCTKSDLKYMIEYDGSGVANSKSFAVGAFLSPDDAFAQMQSTAETGQSDAIVEAFTEQILSSNFTMKEKIDFHAQTVKSNLVMPDTKSFIDYDFDVSEISNEMIGTGKYHQTDVVSSQSRRRLMLDTKFILSKNDSHSTDISALVLYDLNIAEKTSPQYRVGFKRSRRKGTYPLAFSTQSNSYQFGMSLSHKFSHKLYGGVYADFFYRKMDSKYPTNDTTLTGKIETYNVTSGAQLKGQMPLSASWELRPSLALAYSDETLIRKKFISAAELASSIVIVNLSLPSSSRISAQPELFFESPITSNHTQKFMSFDPSFVCERLKTKSTSNTCNTGMFLEAGFKNSQKGVTNKFYFNYENLNNGPRQGYGLQMKFIF